MLRASLLSVGPNNCCQMSFYIRIISKSMSHGVMLERSPDPVAGFKRREWTVEKRNDYSRGSRRREREKKRGTEKEGVEKEGTRKRSGHGAMVAGG